MQKRGARLGQHFLIHSWAAKKLAYAAAPKEGEVILEIGPGKGVLTHELLQFGKVIAIEKDSKLVALLEETFAEEIRTGQLTLLEQDVRDFNPETCNLPARLNDVSRSGGKPGTYIVAANIPYYITGEIIRQFLTTEKLPRAMALLVQKEVADRIVARDGKESILSLSVKAYGTPSIIAKVGKTHFSPPPSVDSAILVIDNISKRFFDDISEIDFFAVVHTGFASKRKMLAGNLSRMFKKEMVSAAFAQCGIEEKARAEDVLLSEWKCLTATLHAH